MVKLSDDPHDAHHHPHLGVFEQFLGALLLPGAREVTGQISYTSGRTVRPADRKNRIPRSTRV
jgi:hypothetical protein